MGWDKSFLGFIFITPLLQREVRSCLPNKSLLNYQKINLISRKLISGHTKVSRRLNKLKETKKLTN